MSSYRRRIVSGFGLIESMLVAASAALLAAGVFTFYSSVAAGQRAHQTATTAIELVEAINRAYLAAQNYSGVSNATVVAENLLPSGVEHLGPVSNPTIVAPYGGTIAITSETVGGIPNRGMRLTYADVPRKLCRDFVSGVAPADFREITINGRSVLDDNRVLLPDQLAARCAENANSTIVLIVANRHTDAALATGNCGLPSPATRTETGACPAGYSGAITRTSTATCLPGQLVAVWGEWVVNDTCAPTCVPEPTSPETRTTTPCPAGQIGAITEQRISACATGQLTGSPSWSEWATISNTCAPQCLTPADESKTVSCPTGQAGSITLRRSAYCPQTTGMPSWGEWTTISNTCAQICVAPPTSSVPEQRTLPCGAGRITPTGAASFTQSRTVTTTYTCPASTGSPVGTDSASGWSPLESSACQQACTPPASHSETRTSTPCPTGQAGVITERRTTSYSCQAPTGLPIESISPWETVSNTCQKVCVLPSPPTETEVSPPKVAYWNKPIVCWQGWSGSEQNTTLFMRRNEVQTRTRNASCATGDVTWSAWSAWSEYTAVSDWVAYSDPCPGRHKCIVPNPPNVVVLESRTAQCGPSRYNINNGSSTFTQTRRVTTMYYCASGYGEPAQYISAEEWAPLEIQACR